MEAGFKRMVHVSICFRDSLHICSLKIKQKWDSSRLNKYDLQFCLLIYGFSFNGVLGVVRSQKTSIPNRRPIVQENRVNKSQFGQAAGQHKKTVCILLVNIKYELQAKKV